MNYKPTKDEIKRLEIIASEYSVDFNTAYKDYKFFVSNYMCSVFGKEKDDLNSKDYLIVLNNLKDHYEQEK